MLHLDYRDSRPLHRQVRDGLRRLMLSGVLQAGDQLPSVRKLATELAINPNTIQRAYAQLEAEGSVRRVSAEGSRKTLYRYRDADVCADHLHLACARCGKTYHMDAAASTSLIRAVAREAGFAVDSASTVLYGVCGNCRKP